MSLVIAALLTPAHAQASWGGGATEVVEQTPEAAQPTVDTAQADEVYVPRPLTDLALARHHAPVHYQDTDSTCYEADYITKIDYDGEWDTMNNWDGLFAFPLNAVAYTSVVETCTHWFIVYGMYHPRDWSDSYFDQEHVNDLEGLLAVVEKDGSHYGRLRGIVTVYHNDFYGWAADSSVTDAAEDIDGDLSFALVDGVLHPMTSQEAKGHGLKAWPYTGDFDGSSGDGIIYVPSGVSEVPTSGTDYDVGYTMVSLFDVAWPQQLADADLDRESALTYAAFGTLKGPQGGCSFVFSCPADAAHMPWAWDDHDDGDIPPGALALDPARVAEAYFGNIGPISHAYTRNAYLADLRSAGYTTRRPPRGMADVDLDALYADLGARCVISSRAETFTR